MAKNNKSDRKKASFASNKNKSGNKSLGEKSYFRVDDSRANKAKKKFVKFNKTINEEKISKLNRNLDSLRTTVRTFQKEESQFVNPIKEASKEYDKISDDLNAAIDKITQAL